MTAPGETDSADVDPAAALRSLTAQFRVQLESRVRSGLLGVSARPTPRLARGAPPAQEAAEHVTDAGGVSQDAHEEPTIEVPPGQLGLQVVRDELGDCQRCRLCSDRRNIVFGVGNPDAKLVFVGEAPGADEDQQGEPFVGKAGQLLTKMIEAMGFSRQDVYICNVIKCRPPGNRNPEPDEVAACEPFLKKQLAALRPRMIVALGKFAAHCLTNEQTPITRLRGNFRSYEGIQVMPTYHPAFLLREPARKKEAWADLQTVIAALQAMGISPPKPPRG